MEILETVFRKLSQNFQPGLTCIVVQTNSNYRVLPIEYVYSEIYFDFIILIDRENEKQPRKTLVFMKTRSLLLSLSYFY